MGVDDTNELLVCRLGCVPYADALAAQRRLLQRRLANDIPDVLLLLEHEPVYTVGRRAEPGELPFGDEWYADRGIEIAQTDRGGKTTYHGPGQLVGYPIVDTAVVGRDVGRFVALIEAAVIDALNEVGIEAAVREGLPGVWVEQRKIGSLGLRITQGISHHGLSLNVDCDLEPFEWIVPCGIEGVEMTSVAEQAGDAQGVTCMMQRVGYAFARRLGARQRLVSARGLGINDLIPASSQSRYRPGVGLLA